MNLTCLNIFILSLIFLFLKSDYSYSSNCYNFIPYAYNGFYSILPKNKTICSNTLNGRIIFKTDDQSGRIISILSKNKNLIAFGESQLLGIDWSSVENTIKHDLEYIFPKHSIVTYASPNNGPYQVINSINKIVIDKPMNFDEILIGFNYGTDIFRIQETWDVENFIPLKTKSMELVLKTPMLYDLIILKGLINNKYFSMDKIKNSDIKKQFLNIESSELNKSIDNFFSRLEKTTLRLKKKPILLIYPPYWGYKHNKNILSPSISKKYYDLVCNKRIKKNFKKILVANPKAIVKLTNDKKHFSMGSLNYINSKELCIN